MTDSARYAVTLTAALGLAVTLTITSAGFALAYENRALHVAKETAGALVLLVVAALLLGRFTRRGTLHDLLALAGVVILAVKNLAFSVMTAILSDVSSAPTTWRTTTAGLLGAGLLAAAAVSAPRLVRNRRRALIIIAGASVLAFAILSSLAEMFDFSGAFTEEPHTEKELRLLSGAPALVVADIGASLLFLVAGVVFGRRAEREADELQMWLGIGSMIAGVGYLNYALFPSSYTDFVYAGDVFRIVAIAALWFGAFREISTYQRTSASAVALEERRRVARLLNDGVVQELASIESGLQRLSRDSEHEESASQLIQSVQRALDESRRAGAALNRPLNEPFHMTLANTAEEATARVGARLELDLDEAIAVPPAWEEALPRIVREAVANAVRHGRARTIAVHLREAGGTSLRVEDDGEGFDLSQPRPENSFGLMGMRERTESLGGQFKLSSTPGHGTSVEIMLP